MRLRFAQMLVLPLLLGHMAAFADATASADQAEFQQAVKRLDRAEWRPLGHFDGTAIQVDLLTLKYRPDGLLEAWIDFKHDKPVKLTDETGKQKSVAMDEGMSLDIWDCKEARSKRLGLVAMLEGKIVRTFVMPENATAWDPLTDQAADQAMKTAICGEG